MALVNYERKAIFIHIYKTGGTSVRSLVGGVEIGGYHAPAWQVRPLLNEWDDFYKFAIVRNPYDLVISLYHHLINQQDHFAHHLVNGLTIDQFVEALEVKYFLRFPVDGHEFFCTQSEWVYWGWDLLVDDVYRFEEMESIVHSLNRRIGTPAENIHINASPIRDHGLSFTEALSPASIAIINRLYHLDFIRFGYAKTNP